MDLTSTVIVLGLFFGALLLFALGWFFAEILGKHRFDYDWERLPVGVIWIGVASLVLWVLSGRDTTLANSVAALMIGGLLGNYLWKRHFSSPAATVI